jgi:hypothetical protein
MASHQTTDDERERQLEREAERYHQAAIEALGQLEWAVRYLHEQRKSEVARALERNRKRILEDIR